MTPTEIPTIATSHLLLAGGLILFAVLMSWLYELGMTGSILIAAARCYIQLVLLGFALLFVFAWDSWLLTLAIICFMMVFAARTIAARLKNMPYDLFWPALAATSATGFFITFAVTGLIIGVTPWYHAQVVVPIAGMVFGNSMNGIALAMERVFSDLKQRREEVSTWIALGATPREAALPSMRAAFHTGLIPSINTMSTVGIVFIPGMMTGQVLAGVDPATASRYQIVIMLMVSAAVALGTFLAVILSYKMAFNALGAPRE